MRKLKIRLLAKLAAIFALATAVGTVLLTVDNVYLNQIPFRNLLVFNIPAILTGDFLILLLLTTLSYRWLGDGDDARVFRIRLMRLPGRMLAALLLISAAFSVLYHYSYFLFHGVPIAELTAADWGSLAKSFVSEQTIALVIGTLQYALSRRAVRPYILALGPEEARPAALVSFVAAMSVATLSCFFIVSTVGYEYLSANDVGRVDIGAIGISAAVRVAFGAAVFYLLILEMRADVRTVLTEVKALLRDGDAHAHRPIPVVSGDELGELAESFNRLQRHMGKAYEETKQELRLAYQVQRNLLPDAERSREGLELAATSTPSRDVGGDLFDIVERPDGGLAVMIGDVSGKGMAASMLMTATLALFRKEARTSASPSALMRRLNALITESLQGRMYVTMGVGFWEPTRAEWLYASAGHVSPLSVRGGKAEEARALPSLPLGIDPDVSFAETTARFAPGDLLLLYTDGIVEAETEDGDLFGFDRLERLLEQLPAATTAGEALRRLTEALPPAGTGRYDDDRTLLLLRFVGEGEERVAG